MKRRMLLMAGLALACSAAIAWASAPVGVTPTLIGRAHYLEGMRVKSAPSAPLDFEAKARSPVDMVVRIHDYQPLSHTGWHAHPGPVFINVLEGELTFYDFNDPTCTPHVVSAGYGYVDTGSGHIAVNRSTNVAAKDVSVIIAPVDGAFRTELKAEDAPPCSFF